MPFNHKTKLIGIGGGGWFRSVRFGADKNTIYTVGDRNNLYITRDGGKTWTEGRGQLNGKSEDLCVDYNGRDNRLLVATDGGVFFSDDSGETLRYMFEQVQNHDGSYGITRGRNAADGNSCTAVEFNKKNIQKMYAGSGGAGKINGNETSHWLSELDDWKVYYTKDGGTTWDVILSGPIIGDSQPQAVYKIRNSWVNENVIYVSTSNEIYKGTESGGNWSWEKLPRSNRPGGSAFDTLDDPDDPDTIYTIWAGWTSSSGPWSYPSPNFYKSTDGGQTWIQKTNGLDSTYSCAQELRFDKSGNGRLWFSNRYPSTALANLFYYSDNKGESWTSFGPTSTKTWNRYIDVATSGDAFGNSVIAVPSDHITHDFGITWDSTASDKIIVQKPGGSETKEFWKGRGNEFINTFNQDYVPSTDGLRMFFSAADHKIIESWDGGVSWKATLQDYGTAVFKNPREENRFNCSLEGGNKKITILDYTLIDPAKPDEPNNRKYKTFDFSFTRFVKIWDSTTDNNGIYYVTNTSYTGGGPYTYEVSTKYRIKDDGFLTSTSWSGTFDADSSIQAGILYQANSGRQIKVSTHNDDDIYLTIVNQQKQNNGLIVRSEDQGDTWKILHDVNYPEEDGNPRSITAIEVDSNGNLFAFFHYDAIYKSTNKGNSWTKLYNGGDYVRGAGGASATSTNGYMYFGTRYPGSGPNTYGVHRSTDGGNNWEQFTSGLQPYADATSITGIAVNHNSPNIVWCTQGRSNGGVYRSTDYGQTWTLVFRPQKDPLGYDIITPEGGVPTFMGVTIDPLNTNHVYFGTQDLEHNQFWYGQGCWKTENGEDTTLTENDFDYIPLGGNNSALSFGANWGSAVRQVYMSVDQKCAYAVWADEMTDVTTPPVLNSNIEDKNVIEGGSTSFYANFSYADTYQWYEEGVAISGANSSTYTITSALIEQNGNTFRCDASNTIGTTQSNNAILTVNPTGANVPNAPTNCRTTVSDNTIIVEWNDNSNNEDGFELEINSSSSYIIISANQTQYIHSGLVDGSYTYRVRAYNSDGNSSWSNAATDTVSTTTDYSVQWTSDGLKINVSANIDSTVAASKIINACKTSGEFSFETWVIPNQESYSYLSRLATICPDGNERNFLFSQQDDQFNLVVRTSNSDEFGNDPSSNPAKGGNVNTSLMHIIATYDGTWRRIYIDGSLAFEDNTALGDLSTWDDTYLLSLGNTVNGGSTYAWYGEFKTMAFYSVSLTPSEVTQNYNEGYITFEPDGVSPTIDSQTSGPITIDEGQSMELYVVATGVPEPSYQWYKDDSILNGEIESSYTIGITTIDDAGNYYCIVSNGIPPNVTSDTIDVFINQVGVAPVIVDQPTNQRVSISPDGLNVETAIFDVAATGENLSYQWYKNGIALTGETFPVLQYTNSTPSDDGSVFTVVITNENGSTISDEAILSVYTTTLDILPINFEYILADDGTLTLKWLESNTTETNINYELWASTSGLYGEYFKIADISAGIYNYIDTDFSGPGETKWYYINSYILDTGQVSQASERISGTIPGGVIGILSVTGPSSVITVAGQDAVFNISVVGGIKPYTYKWYEITENIETMSISGPSNVSVDSGENANFMVTVTGGTGPYTYTWYEISQDAPPPTDLEITGPNPSTVTEGTDAYFTVNVTGGEEPYTYTWYEITEEI